MNAKNRTITLIVSLFLGSGCAEELSSYDPGWSLDEMANEEASSSDEDRRGNRDLSVETDRPRAEPDVEDPAPSEPVRAVFPPDRVTLGTSSPQLRWTGDADEEYEVRICQDSFCRSINWSETVAGLSTRVGTNLEPGVYFWSVRPTVSRRLLASWPRIFVVSPSASSDSTPYWGGVEDLDRDGLADVVATAWEDEPRMGKLFGSTRDVSEAFFRPFPRRSEGFPRSLSGIAVTRFNAENTGAVVAPLVGDAGSHPSQVTVIPSYIRGSYNVEVEADWRSQVKTSLSYVGDVDLNGFDDVAVGAPDTSETGSVYVFKGGDEVGRFGDRIVRLEPDLEMPVGNRFGKTIAGPLDANGDGYSDFVIGADESPRGPGWVYIALGGPDGIELQPPYSTGSTQAEALVDLAVGDYDGDGYPDVVAALRNGCLIHFKNHSGSGFRAEGGFCDDRPREDWIHSVAMLELDGSPGEEVVVAWASGEIVRWDHGAYASVPVTNVSRTNLCSLDLKSPGDFDGDGLDDLLIEGRRCNGTGVFLHLLTDSGLTELTDFNESQDRRR